MHALLLSILIFIGAILTHVVLHRLIRSAAGAVVAYAGGLVLLLFAIADTAFPVTAVFLYGLLVAGYLLYFLSFLNDAESPSAKVLDIVQRHGPMSYGDVLNRFTDEELIGMRVTRLLGSGWIEKKNGKFILTRRGSLVAGWFTLYRRLLHWDEGG